MAGSGSAVPLLLAKLKPVLLCQFEL